MTSSDDPFPYDLSEQDQRVWALNRARNALTKSSLVGGDYDVFDLIHMSVFILTGVLPYADVTATSE